MRIHPIGSMALAIFLACIGNVFAQSTDIFRQDRDGGPVQKLDAQEKAQLQDPLFKLVLAVRPQEIRLAEIEKLIQPNATQQRFFVVHEEILNSRRPATRRAVIDFTGTNNGVNLGANLMLSVSFSSDGIGQIVDIEAWAWDETNGVYNYYKLDRAGTAPNLTWKLRATSKDADLKTAAQLTGSCLGCHTNGAPIMKELLFPWNNWHSFLTTSSTSYLQRNTTPAQRWPVTADPHFAVLAEAQTLETPIMDSIGRFNRRRFADVARPDAQGRLVVADLKRVLRPLFVTTEFNLASANQRSGLHPLEPGPQNGPTLPVQIPDSFFLSSSILGDVAGIGEARGFADVARIPPAEYRTLITQTGVKLRPGQVEVAGDTGFAWFTPETAFVDSDWIATLHSNKLVTPEFVAAVLAVDLETPVFSTRRASLLNSMPDSITVTPGEAYPDALARAVIARLEAANPAGGSAEAEFLSLLKAPDPLQAVRMLIVGYKNRIAGQFANPATRTAESRRLMQLLIDRRRRLAADPILGNLIESDALLPLP